MHYNKAMNKPLRTPDDIRQLGTILFVGAHPDDETFCCGGLLATAVRNGQRVIVVTATRGEGGSQDEERWPPEQMAEVRTRESASAFKVLGITEHHWLDCPDGECMNVSERDVSQYIADIIERAGVETVVTFGPDGLTGHPDHQTMSQWVDAAVHIATRSPRVFHIVQPRETFEHSLKAADVELNMFFMTSQPPLRDADDCGVYFVLDQRSLVQKYRALQAMPSQYTKILDFYTPERFAGGFGIEALVEATDGRT